MEVTQTTDRAHNEGSANTVDFVRRPRSRRRANETGWNAHELSTEQANGAVVQSGLAARGVGRHALAGASAGAGGALTSLSVPWTPTRPQSAGS